MLFGNFVQNTILRQHFLKKNSLLLHKKEKKIVRIYSLFIRGLANLIRLRTEMRLKMCQKIDSFHLRTALIMLNVVNTYQRRFRKSHFKDKQVVYIATIDGAITCSHFLMKLPRTWQSYTSFCQDSMCNLRFCICYQYALLPLHLN